MITTHSAASREHVPNRIDRRQDGATEELLLQVDVDLVAELEYDVLAMLHNDFYEELLCKVLQNGVKLGLIAIICAFFSCLKSLGQHRHTAFKKARQCLEISLKEVGAREPLRTLLLSGQLVFSLINKDVELVHQREFSESVNKHRFLVEICVDEQQ